MSVSISGATAPRLEFLVAPSNAKSLAVFRIGVGLAVLMVLAGRKPWAYAEFSHDLLAEGAKWLPYDAGVTKFLSGVVAASAFAMVVGWQARLDVPPASSPWLVSMRSD